MTLRLLTAAFLTLSLQGSASAQLSQTNLPILVITTSGPVGNTQIQGNMKIINNTTGLNQPLDAPQFQGNIGIKYRGSSTFPKRSYNVETWTNLPGISMDTSLLDMPTENDWVLLASYADRSFLRNLIAFRIWEGMGYYAPRMRLVELIVNNSYQGIYLFGEKIKRNEQRLDIANLKTTDATPPEITGGYIFRLDNTNDGYWTSAVTPPFATSGQTIRFHYDEPEDDDITPVQKSYIKSYTDSFEAAMQASGFQDTLSGWRGFAGHNSFEDYLVLNELLKSRDAFRQSTYLYKDKNKKLRAGPVWDTELALYNTLDCNASKDTGWSYLHSSACTGDTYLAPFWWGRLVSDTAYIRDVKCKYTHWRASILDTASIFSLMDSVSLLLNAEQAVNRNFTQWPVFGVPLINEPVPLASNYGEELDHIKAFIRKRLQFLDARWLTPGCTLAVPPLGNSLAQISIFPNPVREIMTANVHFHKPSELTMAITDLAGRILIKKNFGLLQTGEHVINHNISQLPSGYYLVRFSTGEEPAGTQRLIKY